MEQADLAQFEMTRENLADSQKQVIAEKEKLERLTAVIVRQGAKMNPEEIHLCDSCSFAFPSCPAEKIVWGIDRHKSW